MWVMLQNLYGIWISNDNDAFLVGSSGTILLKSENISAENTAPYASFTLTPSSGNVGTTFYVDASDSSDDQDSAEDLQVKWDWGDGSAATEYSTAKIDSHEYSAKGTYTITLEVKDTGDLTATETKTVQVGEADSDENGDKKCPFAKVLGDDDPRLETLRSFRDQVLSQSRTGNLLLEIYYSKEDYISTLIDSNPAVANFAKTAVAAIVPAIELFVENAE